MPTAYTSLLGLALPVTGELSGTWGDTVNNYITQYVDAAVAGVQTISGSQTAVTLSVTNGSSLVTAGAGATGSAQFQIINCTGNPAGLLTITTPASSRQYIIINATSTSQSVKIVGTGPTTGVTLVAGEKAHVAWNGSDFVKIATQNGSGDFVTVDTTNLEVTNIKAKDGTASMVLTDSTGAVDISKAVTMSATTQNIALGTSQTSGTFTVGGAAQTGTQTFDQSTKTHTLNLGTGATENTLTKTINLGTAGVSGSTTTITVGSTNGTTTTLNGTVTAATLNSTTIDTTNIEVTNIKAKDGTAAIVLTDSTGAVGISTAVTMSATTQNIALGTSQTTGTFTVGGAAQTGIQTFDQSTKTHTLNLGTGATENTLTKTINIGTAGVSGSTTSIAIGSTNGTTTTINGAITASATTQNISLGASQTSGTFTVGGTAQTGNIAIDRSTKTHTLNIGTGITESGQTKTINIGTAGDTGSTTAIAIGSTNGTTITLNGTVNATTVNVTTLDLTNIEVTNIKAKDGTASMSIADSTGVVSITANPVLSGGTANGVLYLNGSKVATSGSALTFDGTNLSVSSASDNVTIARWINASGRLRLRPYASSTLGAIFESTNTAENAYLPISIYGSVVNINADNYISSLIGGSEKIRLNSTSLNIGGNFTSTNNTLQVTGNAAIGYTTAAPSDGLIVAGNVGIGTDNPAWRLVVNAASGGGMQVENSSDSNRGGRIIATGSAGAGTFAINTTSSGYALTFGIDGTEKARIDTSGTLILRQSSNAANTSVSFNTTVQNALTLDSSGNLGLGVTPSAWNSAIKAFDFGSTGAVYAVTDAVFAHNAFVNTSGNWAYKTAAGAGYYQQFSGAHKWFRSTSTPVIGNDPVFSQAMTLHASGGLSVGNTTDPGVGNIGLTNGGKLQYSATAYISPEDNIAGARIVTPGVLNVATGGTAVTMTLDASGNLGLGTTSISTRLQVEAASGFVARFGSNTNAAVGIRLYRNGTNSGEIGSADALFVGGSSSEFGLTTPGANALLFGTNNTERARITSGGDFLIGTTTNKTTSFSGNGTGMTIGASLAPTIALWDTSNSSYVGSISQIDADMYLTNTANGLMVFSTNNTERARITSGGYFKASNAGTYQNSAGDFHELRSSTSGNVTADIRHTNNTNPYGIIIGFTAATPNGTGNYFLNCLDSTAQRAEIRSNGGLANYQSNNVDLSDIRTKTDISPLASYWNKIAALEIVTYKYKDQTHDDLNIGVIAQQVEQVAPEFVDPNGFGETIPEDGVPLKTIYNKDLTFAAIKALQEAMARIEQLEAKVSALENKGA